MATPTRQTSEQELAQWNQGWRTSPLYAQFMQSIGVDPSRPIKLSEQQAKQAEAFLRQNGVELPTNMKIDPAGNVNQENTLGKKVAIGAAIGGAALTSFGLAGMGPLGGALSVGGAGAAGSGSGIGASLLAPGNAAIASAAGGGAAAGGTAAGAGFGASLLAPGNAAIAQATGAGSGGMGILSSIGKFVGNNPNALDAIGRLGNVAAGQARGSQDARMSEARNQILQQQLNQGQSRDTFDAGMQTATFQRQSQDRERKMAILSQLLGQPAQTVTPGNPAIAARMPTGLTQPTMNRDTLMSLLTRPQVEAPKYTPPDPLKLPTGGAGESILGGLGVAGGLLGALTPRRQLSDTSQVRR